jgi:hypothetical protein
MYDQESCTLACNSSTEQNLLILIYQTTTLELVMGKCNFSMQAEVRILNNFMSRVQRYRTLPPHLRGLRHRYTSRGSGPCLPAREGSGAVMCSMAPDSVSPLGRALAPPHIPRLWTPPPRSGGLRRRHVPRSQQSRTNKAVFGCNG